MHALERDVFGCNIPSSYGADWGNPQYEKLLREALQEIASQIQSNLEEAQRNNWYMRDENAEHMREAIRNLEKCGISTFSYDGIVDKLSWFVGGNSYKIRQLQQKLNETGAVDHLTEDGVYGKKTHNAWLDFLDKLAHCSAPTLAWTDLTQSELSKVRLGNTTYGKNNGLTNAFLYPGKRPYIHFDPPHPNQHLTVNGKKIPIDFPHVNLDEKLVGHDAIYDNLFEKYNHYPLSNEAYAVLSGWIRWKKLLELAEKSFLFAALCWMRWSQERQLRMIYMMRMKNLAGKRCQRRSVLADNGAARLWAQSLARCLVLPLQFTHRLQFRF